MESKEIIKQFFMGIKDGFEGFAAIIMAVINLFLLAIVYFFGIGPVAIVAKIRRKHFLELGKEKKDSYWIKKETKKQEIEDYYRMY